jgi:hypothetical protein
MNCKCKLEQHHKAPLNSSCSQIATSLKWNGICPRKQKPSSLPKQLLTTIIVLRGERVILDRDLAEMYGVETRVLKQAVRRNIDRFPRDFMFELTKSEFENWRYQFGTSKGEIIGEY